MTPWPSSDLKRAPHEHRVDDDHRIDATTDEVWQVLTGYDPPAFSSLTENPKADSPSDSQRTAIAFAANVARVVTARAWSAASAPCCSTSTSKPRSRAASAVFATQ